MTQTLCDKCGGRHDVKPVIVEVPIKRDPWSLTIKRDICGNCRPTLYAAMDQQGFNIGLYLNVV